MTFPVTNSLVIELQNAVEVATRMKAYATEASAAMAVQSVSANQVIELMIDVQDAINVWTTTQSASGIAQYAKDQYDDQNIDIAAEFITMKTAAQNVITWIEGNFPKDGNGYILKDKIVSGGLDVRIFNTAATTGLRASLDALAATIG